MTGHVTGSNPVASRPSGQSGLSFLGNLLDHPPEEVRDRLFDPEPFELGGCLTAVVAGVIDNVYPPGGGFLGGADTPGTNDLSDMFVPGVLTPSTLGGTVFKNSGNDGQVVGGLTIVLTGIND